MNAPCSMNLSNGKNGKNKPNTTTAVLFDLDGTLLPMDQDFFVKTYFKYLAEKFAPIGYEPKTLIDSVWKGTAAMVNNNGSDLNSDVFWKCFSEIHGEKSLDDIPLFEDFYRNEFQNAKAVCGFNPLAAKTIGFLKENGVRVVLATNPIFPAVATESRIRWAGLSPDIFELYTTYENSSYSKPNPAYYTEILSKINCAPEECIMVGNDVSEDMAAEYLGMRVFLLTDCLINREGKDISLYPHGDFNDLMDYLKTQLCL